MAGAAHWQSVPAPAWTPSARTGHTLLYSDSLDAVVVFGGLSAASKHASDCAFCTVKMQSDRSCTGDWQALELRGGKKMPTMCVPRRCYHGSAIVGGHASRLLIFGGEGCDEDGHRVLLNDAWQVCLRSGESDQIQAARGAPPAPRMHHRCAILGGSLCVVGGYRAVGPDKLLACATDALHLLTLCGDGEVCRSREFKSAKACKTGLQRH
eukprot:6207176-Pleurochrysis_carterae.AAC.1